MMTGRYIICRIYVYFKINNTQGRPTKLTELLNIELYHDNVRMFNQTWDETLIAIGKELDVDF